MEKPITIFWFRRDLRLNDNCGLYHALVGKNPVLPIFIFDTHILDKLPRNDARLNFIYKTIQNKHNRLQKDYGCGINMYHGNPLTIFKSLVNKFKIDAVVTNHDYEPYSISRDKKIRKFLDAKNIVFQSYKDQVIFEKNDVVKDNGEPYIVYTPYMKKWKSKFSNDLVMSFPSEKYLDNCIKLNNSTLSLNDIGFTTSDQEIAPYDTNPQLIENYEYTRNFPAKESTSHLGPHLRFGTVSIRKITEKAIAEKNPIFLQELIWREFFMQILYHFPYTRNRAFKSKYDRIPWRNDEKEFKSWCEGKTGYPFVDAGMRQLNKTGFMHNRVRMLVGSFLCKHLLIDWRWGEAYFAEKLHDYEMASNVGNWQWIAGCGVDAAPYFRIFNPTTQIKKFDKDLEYINQWITDLENPTYPKPIVDHKKARERCLQIYKEALQ